MSFGDDIKYIHPLGTPFTAQAGAQALTHFSFDQQHTDFERCLQVLIATLVQARQRLSGAAKRAVQIAFMVSDGRIQAGRDRIAKLLRDAEENNILVVLLIVDDTRMLECTLQFWMLAGKLIFSKSSRFHSEDEGLYWKERSTLC